MKKKNILILCILTIVLSFSCSKRGEVLYQKDEGGVRLFLNADISSTKAEANEESVNPNNFKLELINSSNVIFKRWRTFSQYLEQEEKTVLIKVNQDYTVRATYGDSTATGWNKWFFMGESSFQVKQGETKEVSVLAKMANVKVAVKYDPSLSGMYTSFYAKVVNTKTKDKLEFVGEHADEAGYTPAGGLQLYLYVVDRRGIQRTYGMSEPYNAEKGDMVTFNIGTDQIPDPEGDLNINITIDKTTTDKEVNIPLGAYMLSSDAPKLVPEGFDINNGSFAYVEGVSQDVAINVNAPSGISVCTMEIKSLYLRSIGLPEQVDLVNLTDQNRQLLALCGIECVGIEIGSSLGQINFTGMTSILKYNESVDNNSAFTIYVQDGSPAEKSVKATYSLEVRKADIAISEIEPADVWSHSFPVELLSDNGNLDLLLPQIKDAEGKWYIPSYTILDRGTNSVTYNVFKLDSSTEYSVRGIYNNGTTEEERTVVTDSEMQIPNSGFEEFHQSIFITKWGVEVFIEIYKEVEQPIFYPWNSGGETVWDTNNLKTMPEIITATSFNYKCFPSVSFSTSSRSGEKSAQLMAIAVNNGNTSGTSLSDASAGELFIGSYSGGTTGTSLDSRPTKFKFYYQYTPKGGSSSDEFEAYIEVRSGTEIIGNGTFKRSVSKGSPVKAWTEAIQDITYSRTDLKATSVYVKFKSTTMSKPTYEVGTEVNLAGNKYGCHGGSILLLDDLSLIYEK